MSQEREIMLADMEKEAQVLGHVIGAALNNNLGVLTGFALLVFDFGEEGWMTYVSNADPKNMIEAMEELIWRRVRRYSVTEEYLTEVLAELRQLKEDLGGCDHSVNICNCSLDRLIESTEDTLNAYE